MACGRIDCHGDRPRELLPVRELVDMTTAATGRGSRDGEGLMTFDEVAAYVQLSKFTLYKMRAEGHGPPAARLGKHLRHRKSDVDAWIQSKMDDWTDHGAGQVDRASTRSGREDPGSARGDE
jgi:excisionase family DNA binding protein